jgi:hypothetical protein
MMLSHTSINKITDNFPFLCCKNTHLQHKKTAPIFRVFIKAYLSGREPLDHMNTLMTISYTTMNKDTNDIPRLCYKSSDLQGQEKQFQLAGNDTLQHLEI